VGTSGHRTRRRHAGRAELLEKVGPKVLRSNGSGD
jgi:hypothetical protein